MIAVYTKLVEFCCQMNLWSFLYLGFANKFWMGDYGKSATGVETKNMNLLACFGSNMDFTLPNHFFGIGIMIVKRSMSHVSPFHSVLPSCFLFDVSKGLFLYSVI